jgi:prepilin-type N-terminal cleavage/methylation domain-containing protein/prepilin-type processing-associated H-X9-DG protein
MQTPLPAHPRSPERPLAGFTLIELLTVIAIIGILAAIIIPTVGKVRISASSATSKSNLRQLSMAMQLYATDNAGRLPYTSFGGQFPRDQVDMLASTLARYIPLGAEIDAANRKMNVVMLHPRYRALVPGYDAPTYFLVQQPITGVQPFGVSGDLTKKTMTLNTALSKIPSPSRMPMLAEADQKNAMIVGSPSWFSKLPADSAHGSARNVVFYDGHVEGRATSETDFWQPYPLPGT